MDSIDVSVQGLSAEAVALSRIADALEAMRDMRQADAIWGERAAAEVAADTDGLRTEQMTVETSPAYLRGYYDGLKQGEYMAQNAPPAAAAPGRWEPVRGSRRIRCHGGEDELGEYTTELDVQGDNLQMEAWLTNPDGPGSQLVRLSAQLPPGYALCRRVEVSDA